jgi:hypothetical protein
MRKTILVLALAFVFGLTFRITEGKAQMGSGRMGSGYGMGSGMMGGGMMGSGTGQGTWGPREGYQNNPQNGGSQYKEFQKPLGPKEARAILEDYLKSKRNPNLKLGKIRDDGYAFEAEIVTKGNSLVDKILVDKNTGEMRSAY